PRLSDTLLQDQYDETLPCSCSAGCWLGLHCDDGRGRRSPRAPWPPRSSQCSQFPSWPLGTCSAHASPSSPSRNLRSLSTSSPPPSPASLPCAALASPPSWRAAHRHRAVALRISCALMETGE